MIAFDLEVSSWPEEDWDGVSPLGISCAAAAWRAGGGVVTKVWEAEGVAMSPEEVSKMVDDLLRIEVVRGPLYTWNGAGFDFRVMAIECPRRAPDIVALMDRHIDGMLLVTAKYGHYLGLDKAAKGAGLKGKTKYVILNDGTLFADMEGSKAPELWAKGERNAVIEYLKGDAEISLYVGEFQRAQNLVQWVSNNERLNTKEIDFAPVGQLPDRGDSIAHWISDPKTKAEIIAWSARYR